jgi:hypothetical protein
MSTDNKIHEEEPKVEVMVADTTSLSLITKAEIDVQIATAKAFPRSLTQFQRKVMSMATLNEDIAESCTYSLPRAGKSITGPSVRFAEIVASSYGNLRTGARVVFTDDKKVVAQGIVHDLEGNIYHAEEVERSILQHVWENDPAQPGKRRKTGRMETMNEDMKIVAGRAACAIAYRNAIYKVVPAALVQDIHEKVKQVAMGTAETLVARREKRVAYFRGLGVKDEQICEALEVKEINDIDLEKLQLLQGMVTALKNQEATLEGMFPPVTPKNKSTKAQNSTEDKLKKNQSRQQGAKSTEDKIAEGAAENKGDGSADKAANT